MNAQTILYMISDVHFIKKETVTLTDQAIFVWSFLYLKLFCKKGKCEVMADKNQPQFPCRNCIYFNACGENTRTEPCYGRVTKSEKKREERRKSNGSMDK